MALIPWELLDRAARGQIDAEEFKTEALLYARTYAKRGRQDFPDWMGGEPGKRPKKKGPKSKRPKRGQPPRKSGPNKPSPAPETGNDVDDELVRSIKDRVTDDFPSSKIPTRADVQTLWERAEGNEEAIEALFTDITAYNEQQPVKSVIGLMLARLRDNGGPQGVVEHARAVQRRRENSGKSVIDAARAEGRERVSAASAELIESMRGEG